MIIKKLQDRSSVVRKDSECVMFIQLSENELKNIERNSDIKDELFKLLIFEIRRKT